MKLVLRLTLGLCLGLGLVVALPAAAFFVAGPDRVWTSFVGPGDQGPVDIRTLSRRTAPNDALACTPGLCAARADIALPADARAPVELLDTLDAIVLADRTHLTRVDDGTRADYRRYVARTPIMRYPDTIDALVSASPDGTRLALYSRSQIGSDDWGVNRRRLEGWIAALDSRPDPASVGAVTPVS